MKGTNNDVLMEIYVNEAYAETFIKQTYENIYSYPVELIVNLPKKNGLQFVDFEVEINDKKVKSKLISKEKAVEKYSDAIASGNTGIYSEYNKELDKYIIHLGNIEPQTKVNFKSHFLQSIISNDLNYLYRIIDQFPFPKYQNNSNYQPQYKIKAFFQTSSPITILEQKIQGNNPIIRNRFNEDRTKYEIELFLKSGNRQEQNSNFFSSYKNNDILVLSFEFQIKDFKKPKLYKQYDPKNDETTYLLSYFQTIHDEDNFNNNEITKSFPGLYYFVIDQSGSMDGYPISIVIQTLKVFMQSLSKGSYYQLIGFGSTFKSYSDKPLSYTKENVNKTIKEIENLNGNMGGTDLFKPLEFIYNNYNENKKLNLPQNIFILTDGYTENKQNVLNIIEKNNSKYQVYAYGIGNDFDRDFIRTAGECGFGSYKFINDISNLRIEINEQLRKCLRVYYDKVKFSVEKNNNNEILYEFYRNEFILENQLVDYFFIMKGKSGGNIEIKNSFNENGKEINQKFNFDEKQILYLKDGDILSKITMHNLIQKGDGVFSEEEKVTKIAKKYQVLCQYTSLFAEIENTQSNKEPNLQVINVNNTGNLFYFPSTSPNNIRNINPNGLFGNNQGIIFGNSNTNSLGLFGNNSNTKTGSLFRNNNNNHYLSNNNTTNTGSLFGNNNNNNYLSNNNITNTGSLFGNNNNNHYLNNNNTTNTGSLFGNNNNNNNNKDGSNINITNTGGLFGNNNNNKDGSDNKTTNTGSLFGNNNNTLNPYEINNSTNKECLFGNNNNFNCNQNIFDNNIKGSNVTLESSNHSNINKNSGYNNEYINNKTVENNNSDILENIILSLDIIEGYWEEDQYTKKILDIKSDIYNKVKNLIGNNRISVTFVILFYILNDKKEKIPELSNIINKAKTFLVNNNCSYEFIKSQIEKY